MHMFRNAAIAATVFATVIAGSAFSSSAFARTHSHDYGAGEDGRAFINRPSSIDMIYQAPFGGNA